MKITITLKNVPLSIVMEGSDEEMANMVDVATETMVKMKKIWLNTLKRQTELKLEKEGKNK